MRKFTLVLVSGLSIDKRPQGRVVPLPNVNVLALGGFVEPDEIASGDLVKHVAQTMKNANAYNYALHNDLMEEFSEKYFIELRHRWSLDELIKLSKKYNSYIEFRKNEPKVVSILSNHKNWRNEIKNKFK